MLPNASFACYTCGESFPEPTQRSIHEAQHYVKEGLRRRKQMSELDNKLRSILEKAGVSYRKSMSAKDAVVDEIKQAFKEAGYVQYDPRMQFDKYGNLKINGEEWYQRFKKELEGKAIPYKGKTDDDITATLTITEDAARRASGLEDSQ